MEWVRDRTTIKYLFASEKELDRLLDVYGVLSSHESVSDLSDEPQNPRSASITIQSEFGFWGIDSYSQETPPVVTVSANNHVFDSEDPVVDGPSFSKFVDFAVEIHEILNPSFAYGVELYDMTEPPLVDGDLDAPLLMFVPWFTVFTPAQVAELGRETVLATPAPRVEELDDGCILMITHNPLAEAVDVDVEANLGIPSARDYDRERGIL